jgi:HEAT repeat protein
LHAVESIDRLAEFLHEESDILQAAAAQALARLNDSRALPLLRETRQSTDHKVSGTITEAIRSLEASSDG